MAKSSYHGGGGGSGRINHNDREREFKRAATRSYDYIDDARSQYNVNISFNGGSPQITMAPLTDVHLARYKEVYSPALEEQNAKHVASRHLERIKTIEDWSKDQRHGARETLLQIGSHDKPATYIDGRPLPPDTLGKELLDCFLELDDFARELLGEHYQPISAALHMDELTPHVHWDWSIASIDEDGLLKPALDKGLEQAGINLPDPDRIDVVRDILQKEENEKAATENRKPKKINLTTTKYNNRLVTLTAIFRTKFEDIVLSHGIDIDRSERCDRPHEDQNRYRAKKLKENIATQETKIAELDTIIDQKKDTVDTILTDATLKASDIIGQALQQASDITSQAKENAYQDELTRLKNDDTFRGDVAAVVREELREKIEPEIRESIIEAAHAEAAEITDKGKEEAANAVKQARTETKAELKSDPAFIQAVKDEIRADIQPQIEREVRAEVEAAEDGSTPEYRKAVTGIEKPDIERHVRRDSSGKLALNEAYEPQFGAIRYHVTPHETVTLSVADYPTQVREPFLRRIFGEVRSFLRDMRDKILGDARREAAEIRENALRDDPINAYLNEKLDIIPLVDVKKKTEAIVRYCADTPMLSTMHIDADITAEQVDEIESKARADYIDRYVDEKTSHRWLSPYEKTKITKDAEQAYPTSDDCRAIRALRRLVEDRDAVTSKPHTLDELRARLGAAGAKKGGRS